MFSNSGTASIFFFFGLFFGAFVFSLFFFHTQPVPSPEKKHKKEKITLSHQVSAAFKTISQMSNDFVVVWLFMLQCLKLEEDRPPFFLCVSLLLCLFFNVSCMHMDLYGPLCAAMICS